MPSFNLFQVIILLGAINSIILFISLSSLPLRFRRSGRLLGLFIVCYTLNLTNWMILPDLGVYLDAPVLWLPVLYFLPALTYFFANTLVSDKNISRPWLYLIPGLADVIYQLVYWFRQLYLDQPYSFQMDRGLQHFLYEGIGILFSAFCLAKIYQLIQGKAFKKGATFIFYRYVLVFMLILFARWIILYSVDLFAPSILTFSLYFTFWVIELAGFLFVGYKGLVAPNKYAVKISSVTSHNQVGELAGQLLETVRSQKLYMNPNLTRRDLAEQLSVSEIQISSLLNDDLNTTFYGLINQLRVEETKSLIADGLTSQMTLEGIGEKSGFKSKATFYKFFKQLTGVTPSEYVRKIGT